MAELVAGYQVSASAWSKQDDGRWARGYIAKGASGLRSGTIVRARKATDERFWAAVARDIAGQADG